MQMRDMNAVLLSKPDEWLAIKEDADAKAFLLQFGLLGQFRTDLKNPRMQVVTYDIHKTHFIVGILFSGHEKDSDNGYLIHCLPKSKYSKAQIEDFMKTQVIPPGPMEVIRPIPKDNSPQN